MITLDGHMLRKMVIAGANKLAEQKEMIDALNVFPVPDGDTGTNMSLTALAAAREVEKLNTANVCEVAKAASSGALRGARGNSGVILSQLFRGFSRGLDNCETVSIDDVANGFVCAVETSYKAVMKPKEGTILTVAREISEKALELTLDLENIEEFLVQTIEYGNVILKKTTDMLPVLKQAGVVDAGGQGLLSLLEGALESIHRDDVVYKEPETTKETEVDFSALNTFSHEDITFGYCTEFFIKLPETSDAIEDELKAYLSTIGDSIVVVGDEDIIKIHVHTDNPGLALEKAVTFGALDNLKIENMRLQHAAAVNGTQNKEQEQDQGQNQGQNQPKASVAEEMHQREMDGPQEKKDIGFVVVSMGEGLKELFKSLGVDVVIEGGQTMNPSAEDIIAAVEKVNADNVIVLPNNKNIVLAAQQASELCQDKKVVVLPSKSIPQGISAMINFIPELGLEENVSNMEEGMKNVKTGQITYAVRDTVIGGKEIKEGDFLCMYDGEIRVVSQALQPGAKELLAQMIDENSEVVSIFYGADTQEETAKELEAYLLEKYPDVEVEIQNGTQPLYYYIFSVE